MRLGSSHTNEALGRPVNPEFVQDLGLEAECYLLFVPKGHREKELFVSSGVGWPVLLPSEGNLVHTEVLRRSGRDLLRETKMPG